MDARAGALEFEMEPQSGGSNHRWCSILRTIEDTPGVDGRRGNEQ